MTAIWIPSSTATITLIFIACLRRNLISNDLSTSVPQLSVSSLCFLLATISPSLRSTCDFSLSWSYHGSRTVPEVTTDGITTLARVFISNGRFGIYYYIHSIIDDLFQPHTLITSNPFFNSRPSLPKSARHRLQLISTAVCRHLLTREPVNIVHSPQSRQIMLQIPQSSSTQVSLRTHNWIIRQEAIMKWKQLIRRFGPITASAVHVLSP